MTEKEYFERNVAILYDSREQEIYELLTYFAHNGINTKLCKEKHCFKQGDWSFEIDGKDYRGQFLIERKGCLGEIYKNVMDKNKDENSDLRNNLEEEFQRMTHAKVEEKILIIQGVSNLSEVKNYRHRLADKQGAFAGLHIYSTLMSWQCANRYNFKVVCRKTPEEVAEEILNRSYYYWRNEMKKAHGDNFLKAILSPTYTGEAK